MSKRYTLLKKDGKARRGRFETPHGTIETPVFMNVGTLAARWSFINGFKGNWMSS